MKHVAVIGAGFSGLAAACTLASAGFRVSIFEKNSTPGGRARKFEASGFTFDMGPSWYWMPDVFENFFNQFGKTTGDFYTIKRLDPSYRIYFGKNDYLDLPAGRQPLLDLFESVEPGSGIRLEKFLRESKFKYDVGINKLIHKPGRSILELADPALMSGIFKLHIFRSIASYIRKNFREQRLQRILEFPVLFLGATAEKTPALYSLMNYADLELGTWYPMGGMYRVVEGMTSLARSLGVDIGYDSPVESLVMSGASAKGVTVRGSMLATDYVVSSADYHHVEQQLLPAQFRKYGYAYWEERVLAPSCLLFFLGVNKRVEGLQHHTLFFDGSHAQHEKEIYDDPQWPSAPQFYVSCPSKSDPTVAPTGCENLLLLIPVAAGLRDQPETREQYFNLVMDRLESLTGQQIRNHIVYKRSYAHSDFITDYNAFKGNAYGLANTLRQTANLKPSIINRKVQNLFYTGQLTVPGPGVPPAIISGQVVAREIIKTEKKKKYRRYESII